MKNTKQGSCVKIKHFQYSSVQTSKQPVSSKSLQRNPIKIVVDKIEMDGEVSEEIANRRKIKTQRSNSRKSPRPLARFKSTQLSYVKPESESRSFVFNRFQYDNYQPFSLQKARQPDTSRRLPSSSHKNIQIVFCESKLPHFVQKTNDRIEEIYRKQMALAQPKNRNYLVESNSSRERSAVPVKTYKITLANTLKEYGTLQKLSIFMESDRNLQQKCLCDDSSNDPSRTVLLDIITHRFAFMKSLNRRIRQKIYCNLFGRDSINPFTKINIYEYMRFTEMFVGRCSNSQQVAVLMCFVLFGNEQPSFEVGKQVIQQIHGSLHKQRAVIELLHQIFSEPFEYIVNVLSNNHRILKLFVDLIVEK